MLPFCVPLSDDFDRYGDDMVFAAVGEQMGPWGESGNNASDVGLTPAFQIQTHEKTGYAYLHSKNGFAIGPTTCAITVRLVAPGANAHDSGFGIGNAATNSTNYAFIMCNNAALGVCHGLGFVGNAGADVDASSGLDLGIVVKDGTKLFAMFDDGTGWQLVSNQPAEGTSAPMLLGGLVYPAFGQFSGDATSLWDDFDVRSIPAAAVP
jgi:hypothetical protein